MYHNIQPYSDVNLTVPNFLKNFPYVNTELHLYGNPHNADDDIHALFITSFKFVAPHSILVVVPVGSGCAVHTCQVELANSADTRRDMGRGLPLRPTVEVELVEESVAEGAADVSPPLVDVDRWVAVGAEVC